MNRQSAVNLGDQVEIVRGWEADDGMAVGSCLTRTG